MSLNIKTADGYQSLASLGGNVINGAEMQHYSTEERIIGYWADGKPIYRKRITTTPIVFNIWITLESNTVYDTITSCRDNAGNDMFCYDLQDDKNKVYCWNDKSTNSLKLWVGQNNKVGISSGQAKNLWIEYTKTTDQPITNNNTYSTDEVLTGKTWIDGKPIYRKVSRITRIVDIPYNQWNGIAFSSDNGFSWLSNVDAAINMYMLFLSNSAANYVSYLALSVNKDLNLLNCFNTRNTPGLQLNTDFYVIAEYTKTTD